jgi:maltooligosyltrehalose trehalohydrolase
LRPEQFVVCSQNHDQIGNRAAGDRLSASLDADHLKLAAATTLLSPFVPLLFMGEEYGETVPFPYFTSHSDPALADAVRRGRREEFAAFGRAGEVPDPQAESTFNSAKLQRPSSAKGRASELGNFYRALIQLRNAAGIAGVWPTVTADTSSRVLSLEYRDARVPLIVVLNFGTTAIETNRRSGPLNWQVVLSSAADAKRGATSPDANRTTTAAHSVTVFAPADAATAMGAS